MRDQQAGGTGFFGKNFKLYVEHLGGEVVTVGSSYDLSIETDAEKLFTTFEKNYFDYSNYITGKLFICIWRKL